MGDDTRLRDCCYLHRRPCCGAENRRRLPMTVALCMIVKNEAHVIRRYLESHKDVIDTWCIVDTGSTDGTQQIVRDTMAELGIPGELHEREWIDFGTNKTEMLQLAKGRADYLLQNDADHIWHGRLPKNLDSE